MYECVQGVELDKIKFVDYFKISRTRKEVYCDNIMCFDIETSSAFLHPTQTQLEPWTGKSQEYYSECEKFALMYIWMFSIDDNIYIGRTWEDLQIFMDDLDNIYPFKKIVYVHNLSFDWAFTVGHIPWNKIFAREKRHVMYADANGYTFRCSYMLTQMKLETWANQKNLPVKKLVGNLDYNILRTPKTTLTSGELDYCTHDVMVMYHGLLRYRNQYEHVAEIPLTQTGEVRREFQKRINVPKLLKYRKRCCDLIPDTLDEYRELVQIFMGGYTHANYLLSGKIIEKVQSWDISSSYPTVMCLEQFPYTKFQSIKFDKKYMNNPNYSYIIEVEFLGIQSTKWNSFISVSKCVEIRKGKYDNGRVLRADYLCIKLTNIDFEILLKCYKYEEMNILQFKIAHNKPLPNEFVLYVLELFQNKTKYKNVDGYEATYNQSKQYINSSYGMMVTRLLTDDITYTDLDGWGTTLLNEELYKKKSEKERKKLSKTFTAFQFGVWVTAYARRNIWSAILEINQDLAYTDTDSVKFINNHDEFFKQYNGEIIEKQKEVCERLNIPLDSFSPKDPKGIAHTMGLYEYEETYDKFITLGAKKYCVEVNGELHQTVAGVSKSAVSQLSTIEDFKIDLEYQYDPITQPKLLSHYADNMRPITWNKGQYDEWYSTDTHGICMQPTTYKMGMSIDYLMLLMENANNGKTEILQHNPIIAD